AEVVTRRVGEGRARAGVEAVGRDDSGCRPGGGHETGADTRDENREAREERPAPHERRPRRTKVMHDPLPFQEVVRPAPPRLPRTTIGIRAEPSPLTIAGERGPR